MSKVIRLFAIATITGCAAPNVTISTDEPVQAVIQPLGAFDAETKPLGTLPVTLPASELAGKMVRVEASSGRIYYWMFPPAGDGPLDIKFKAATPQPVGADTAANKSATGSAGATNKLMRLTLEAYDALGRRQPEVALRLAQELGALEPGLAVGKIVEGLAKLQGGDREGAKAALVAARALDPEDQKIADMLTEL